MKTRLPRNRRRRKTGAQSGGNAAPTPGGCFYGAQSRPPLRTTPITSPSTVHSAMWYRKPLTMPACLRPGAAATLRGLSKCLQLDCKSSVSQTLNSLLSQQEVSSAIYITGWKRPVIPVLADMRMEILPGSHRTTSIKSSKNVHLLVPEGLFSEICLK